MGTTSLPSVFSNAKHQDEDADDAASDEQEPLSHIHPHDSLHTAKQRQYNNGNTQDEYYTIYINVKERRQRHRYQEEDGSCLREMSQREGERRIEACEESETTFEILVRRQSDDLTEQRYDDANECNEYDGYHQSLNQ